jgi:hypothetical protein
MSKRSRHSYESSLKAEAALLLSTSTSDMYELATPMCASTFAAPFTDYSLSQRTKPSLPVLLPNGVVNDIDAGDTHDDGSISSALSSSTSTTSIWQHQQVATKGGTHSDVSVTGASLFVTGSASDTKRCGSYNNHYSKGNNNNNGNSNNVVAGLKVHIPLRHVRSHNTTNDVSDEIKGDNNGNISSSNDDDVTKEGSSTKRARHIYSMVVNNNALTTASSSSSPRSLLPLPSPLPPPDVDATHDDGKEHKHTLDEIALVPASPNHDHDHHNTSSDNNDDTNSSVCSLSSSSSSSSSPSHESIYDDTTSVINSNNTHNFHNNNTTNNGVIQSLDRDDWSQSERDADDLIRQHKHASLSHSSSISLSTNASSIVRLTSPPSSSLGSPNIDASSSPCHSECSSSSSPSSSPSYTNNDDDDIWPQSLTGDNELPDLSQSSPSFDDALSLSLSTPLSYAHHILLPSLSITNSTPNSTSLSSLPLSLSLSSSHQYSGNSLLSLASLSSSDASLSSSSLSPSSFPSLSSSSSSTSSTLSSSLSCHRIDWATARARLPVTWHNGVCTASAHRDILNYLERLVEFVHTTPLPEV